MSQTIEGQPVSGGDDTTGVTIVVVHPSPAPQDIQRIAAKVDRLARRRSRARLR